MLLFSDGIGRTGTFCALAATLERFKTEQMVDVFHTIKTIRIQRAGMVQTLVSILHSITVCNFVLFNRTNMSLFIKLCCSI